MSPLRSRSGGKVTVVAPIRSARPASKIFGQRAAVGGDHPDVDRMAAVQADRPHFAGGQHSVEQLLRLRRKRRNLVENQRAAVGLDELARLRRERARERAFFVTEQLAVDDVGGDRLAVERQQRALGAQARGVDRAGERFLARARLADDEHRQAVARRFGGDREGGAEFGRCADQLLERERRSELLRNRRELASGAAAIGIGGERFEQPLRTRPDAPGNRTRRRASPRPRRRRCRRARAR